MPRGCNEQIFSAWIPNIVTIRYLDSIKNLTKTYRDRGKANIEAGYQKLSNIRNDDGSYNMFKSSFKKQPYEPNVWLTAYIAKLLSYTKNLYALGNSTDTQDKFIVGALNYLSKVQLPNGNFPNQTLHYDISNNSSETVALTAFVAIAFMQNDDYVKQSKVYKTVVSKALNYIDSGSSKIKDNYDLALVAYALAINKHRNVNDFLNNLVKNMKHNNGMAYWNREFEKSTSSESPSLRVEIASYAIMAFMKANRFTEIIPIMKWLQSQRNENGGFHSTTDTTVGIEALAMMAEKLHINDTNIDVAFIHEKTFTISKDKSLKLQHKKFLPNTRKVLCTVTGTGFAYVQVAYSFKTIAKDAIQRFDLTASDEATESRLLNLKVCARLLLKESAQMTLIEVYLPSGYVYDQKTAALAMLVGVKV